jgi:hypothetical protein
VLLLQFRAVGVLPSSPQSRPCRSSVYPSSVTAGGAIGKGQERADMGGVDQPLLSISTQGLPNNGAINQDASCSASPPLQSRRFLDRSGRFNQSLGTFKYEKSLSDVAAD